MKDALARWASLSETYGVSRSSIKGTGILAQQGIIFKKRGRTSLTRSTWRTSALSLWRQNLGLPIVSNLMAKQESSCLTTGSACKCWHPREPSQWYWFCIPNQTVAADWWPAVHDWDGLHPNQNCPPASPAVVTSPIFNYLEDKYGKRVTKSSPRSACVAIDGGWPGLAKLEPTELE